MVKTLTPDQEKAEDIRIIWDQKADEIPSQIKDQIGKLYITKILGLSQQVADAFARGDSEAYHQVGLKQSSITETNTAEFWNEVSKLIPHLHFQHQTQWLIEKGRVLSAFIFIFELSAYTSDLVEETHSDILNALRRNAHVYK